MPVFVDCDLCALLREERYNVYGDISVGLYQCRRCVQ